VLALLLSSCGGASSSPTPLTCPPPLDGDGSADLVCRPDQSNLRCTFDITRYRRDDGPHVCDVTGLATWTVSDPAIATVAFGFVTVLGHGEVDVAARYGRFVATPRSFLVDRDNSPQQLNWFSGFVRENDSNAAIPDVLVEVLSGYSTGRSARSDPFGHYKVERVLPDEPFIVRASKQGYKSVTAGFAIGGSRAPFLDFRLDRTP
jgi:hypothetical protein